MSRFGLVPLLLVVTWYAAITKIDASNTISFEQSKVYEWSGYVAKFNKTYASEKEEYQR